MSSRMNEHHSTGADDLVRRLNLGDESAYAELWHANHRRLSALAYGILRDSHEAEDAVQEAFTNLVRKVRDFRGEAKIQTWLYVVVLNAARMRLRKRKNSPRIAAQASPLHELEEDSLNTCPATRMSRMDQAAWLHEQIRMLDPSHQEILRLRSLEQRDSAETARRLQISLPAARSRFFRARRALRERIEEQGALGSATDSIGA